MSRVLWLSLAACLFATPGQQTFRTTTTMVPLDVRVLDADGMPVTDLERGDFTVLEDKVPQVIDLFLKAGLTAGAPAPPLLPVGVPWAAPELKPQTRRIFLIVIGRGRQRGPVKVFEALAAFVRERLLPQDQVAVVAYNRAAAFSTDHESIAAVLERYREIHPDVEALMNHHANVLRGWLADGDLPAFLQDRIDEIFTGVAGPGPRTVDELEAQAEVRARQVGVADDLARAAANAGRRSDLPDPGGAFAGDVTSMSFDEYIAQRTAATLDVNAVRLGIEYLRQIEGEKHLLHITDRGLSLWDSTDEDGLAAVAADARVAVDFIHTAGVVAAPIGRAVPLPGQVFGQTFAVRGLRAVADLTGGQAWAFTAGDHALERLDQATRFQYLLGYVPTNALADGSYRAVSIRVTRPNVTVLYRHGYFARQPEDEAAAGDEMTDYVPGATGAIAVEADASLTSGDTEVAVDIRIDGATFDFPTEAGLRVNRIEIVTSAADRRGRLLARATDALNFQLNSQSFSDLRRTGITHTARLAVEGAPQYVRVVVRDTASGREGVVVVELPKTLQ